MTHEFAMNAPKGIFQKIPFFVQHFLTFIRLNK